VILDGIFIDVFIRSTFSEFASKWSRDPRFRAIEKMRERESLFSEYILEVRRQEDTDSRGQIERVSSLMVFALCAVITVSLFSQLINFV